MPARASISRLPAAGRLAVALALLLAAALSVHLLPEWLHNPDLSHGLFAPVLFALLLREAIRRGPFRYFPENTALRLARAGALAAGLGLVAFAGLFAAAIGWSHALSAQCLAFALSAFLLAALLWLSSDRVRLLPFNWTTLVAAGLWPLCAPLPPGTYSRLTLQLQRWVTDIVLGSLHLLGIPASAVGNIIQVGNTSVGVEEACSGVRSLVSCVVAAIVFSAALVRRPWARALLVALSAPLAFGMNIVRSLTLTLLARSGVDISGAWHDYTGFAILGVTAALLGGLALWLEDDRPGTPPPAPASAALPRPWGLVAAQGLAILLLGFFILNTHGSTRAAPRPPDLGALLPARPPGWDLVRTDDLYRFTSILETRTLAQRTYVRRAADGGEPLVVIVYVAYWAPGQVPVSLVASHTPDACWPGAGWIPARDAVAAPSPFLAGGRPVSVPEYRVFTNDGARQNVWFWHLHGGRSITQADPRSPAALLRLALDYGFRADGEQFFVRISSNRPWSEVGAEPLVAGILAQLAPHGL